MKSSSETVTLRNSFNLFFFWSIDMKLIDTALHLIQFHLLVGSMDAVNKSKRSFLCVILSARNPAR